MLIDDEAMVGQRLKGGLEKMGCSVEIIVDATVAMDRIKEKTYDIVVTDIMMPNISGMQVLEAIKATGSDTRVIIISGFANASLAREAMEKGAFDMIAKPFKPTDLRKLVAKAAKELGFDGVTEPE